MPSYMSSRFRGPSASSCTDDAMLALLTLSLAWTGGDAGCGDGPRDDSDTDAAELLSLRIDDAVEDREDAGRGVKNEPTQPPNRLASGTGGGGGWGMGGAADPLKLRGLKPLPRNGGCERSEATLTEGGREGGELPDLLTSSALLDVLAEPAEPSLEKVAVTGVVLVGLRGDSQRPRSPSTAFMTFVEPAVSVRDIASLVGASCWSSLSSWIPSDNRSPTSDRTEGFSLHGCLHSPQS